MQFKRYVNHSMCFDMENDPKHVEEMTKLKKIKKDKVEIENKDE